MIAAEELVRALRWGLIEVAASHDFRARCFPPGTACACGVASPLLLVIGSSPVRCYECDRRGRGRSVWEGHHIGGKGSPFIAPLQGNRHRLHDAAYQDVLERLPLSQAERIWLELQLFVVLEQLLDEAKGRR